MRGPAPQHAHWPPASRRGLRVAPVSLVGDARRLVHRLAREDDRPDPLRLELPDVSLRGHLECSSQGPGEPEPARTGSRMGMGTKPSLRGHLGLEQLLERLGQYRLGRHVAFVERRGRGRPAGGTAVGPLRARARPRRTPPTSTPGTARAPSPSGPGRGPSCRPAPWSSCPARSAPRSGPSCGRWPSESGSCRSLRRRRADVERPAPARRRGWSRIGDEPNGSISCPGCRSPACGRGPRPAGD